MFLIILWAAGNAGWECFVVFGGHLKNLIYKVMVVIEFEQHLLEQLDLKLETPCQVGRSGR
ncbi:MULTISPECIES: hypothetical protein [Rhizobium]|uniref:Uncharacterized protein n=1 Tax=Rhizobium favelukesii TaxID=348824 RepID=W6RQX8_9HYPH|nr:MULTISPECIES: hypothetical protein [Rhizobium]MCA0806648.1 hypothetical protein [Rhizobium sp. T1473]MCS0459844.1 hypothetical protein [Rhizobium favelukesii]UFS85259.1 hypothetical protein LPB79_36990 [Rhizobium sp. T136]CDM61268.1 hypothetical protein LPU83_pLPU83c_0706 [Rhizobium favelukesii]